jgi:nitroreductase/NAD-dependent dihydropyrimidine dehydrogenase PreA subunit
MSKLTIDREKCKKDGVCVAECPVGVIVRGGAGEYPEWHEQGVEFCVKCGHCVSVCPHGALSLGEMTPESFAPMRKELLPSAEQAEHFLKARRSIRTFKDKPVDRETIEKLIDIARYAPSGHNTQPVSWLVIYDTAKVRRMAALVAEWMRMLVEAKVPIAAALHMDKVVEAWDRGDDKILRNAPHVVVAHADKDAAVSPGSCMIAVTYLELAAFAQGLGACWAGYFNVAAGTYPPLAAELGLPKNNMPFGSLMVGLPTYSYSRIPCRIPARISWL